MQLETSIYSLDESVAYAGNVKETLARSIEIVLYQ
jgi:hypothetical protein